MAAGDLKCLQARAEDRAEWSAIMLSAAQRIKAAGSKAKATKQNWQKALPATIDPSEAAP